MKTTILAILVLAFALPMQAQTSFYDFKVKDIDGNDFDFATLKGKKVMIVNVASKCGLTPQYAELQELYNIYGGDDFEIVAFPANNFLHQEPGTNEEIKEFCTDNYGITFKMMEKISVRGNDIHPLYRWLTEKSENGVMNAKVTWNFQKFLIDEHGKLIDVVPPRESPQSKRIVDWIRS